MINIIFISNIKFNIVNDNDDKRHTKKLYFYLSYESLSFPKQFTFSNKNFSLCVYGFYPRMHLLHGRHLKAITRS